MWARLSPHPAFEDPEPRRVRPTRSAPIAIFLRESADWLEACRMSRLIPPAGEVLTQLQSRGACFFNDLVRATRGFQAKWRTGFGNWWRLDWSQLMVSKICDRWWIPSAAAAKGRGKYARPRHAAGRWALVRHAPNALTDEARAAAFANQLLERWVSSSVTCWHVRRWRHRGAICCLYSAGKRHKARFAVAVSSPASAVNNSPGPKRWTCCAPSAAPIQA